MLFLYCFISLIFLTLLYITLKHINKPVRKLKAAQKKKAFYMLDDPADVRKNFFLTYKGLLFEGEKYPNHNDEVESIFIWHHNNNDWELLGKEDILEIEKKIFRHYPATRIDWKSADPSS